MTAKRPSDGKAPTLDLHPASRASNQAEALAGTRARMHELLETTDLAERLELAYAYEEAKAKGVLRLEGKTYTVNDGDIMNILANK